MRRRPKRCNQLKNRSTTQRTLPSPLPCVLLGEWRGGIAPPRSPRTGREPLDSSGSRHPVALRHDTDLPVGEEADILPRHVAQPTCGPSLAESVSLVFPTCPANQPPMQASEGSPQRRGIVPAVVVDPPANLRLEQPRQVLQFQMA